MEPALVGERGALGEDLQTKKKIQQGNENGVSNGCFHHRNDLSTQSCGFGWVNPLKKIAVVRNSALFAQRASVLMTSTFNGRLLRDMRDSFTGGSSGQSQSRPIAFKRVRMARKSQTWIAPA